MNTNFKVIGVTRLVVRGLLPQIVVLVFSLYFGLFTSYLSKHNFFPLVRHPTESIEVDGEQHVWLSRVREFPVLRQTTRGPGHQAGQRGGFRCMG